MFDNPEKLFILLVIALLIFGPSKLASLGGSMGRAIRDFRSAVRGAQESFGAAAEELKEEFKPEEPTDPEPLALPEPAPAVPSEPITEPHPEATMAPELEGPDSLASEPSAEAVGKMPGWKPSSE